MLAATFEMAVADAELRAAGRSLADDLGVEEGFAALAVGEVVGIPADHDVAVLRQEVDAAVRSGPGGPGCASRSSPGGWSIRCTPCGATIPTSCCRSTPTARSASGADDVALLNRLADYDVLCIEQPLQPADLVAHAQLGRRPGRAHLPGRVALDPAPRSRTRCATARAPWPA